MLEKRILINEAGDPILETKINSYTVVRRALNEEELAVFKAQQKGELPTEAKVEKEEPLVAPPVFAEVPVEKEIKPKAKEKAKAKDKPAEPPKAPVGVPVE